jgi:hypothetical protein
MKNFLLVLSFFFSTSLIFGQTVILDFEDAATSTDYQYFGSTLDGTAVAPVANPDASGINTSANVMAHEKPDGSETWAGAFPNPNPATPLEFVTATQMCVDVWSPETGTVSLKLENSTSGGPNWITTKDILTASAWTQVCFDVSEASIEDPFQPAQGNTYETVVIFFDFCCAGTGATYYWDNLITQGMGATDGDITFAVDMNDYADPFTQVYVSGTFNNWAGDANPLEDADGDGVWTGTIADLPVGQHEFKFTLDNGAAQEEFTGGETCTVSDGTFVNRRLVISGDATLDTYCFNSCYECGGAVRITINLGTSNIMVDPAGMYIAGGGNFGNPGDFPLNDADGDGVWSMTYERPMGFETFYTFTNGACPDWSCKEDISGQSCANPDNFNDRKMGPVMEDLVISTCYAICTDNTDCGGGVQPADITFQVDMNGFSDPFDQVYVSGNFNNWSGDGNPLDDADGDGVWEGTISLNPGDYEYKFTLDNWAADEIFADGDPCTITDPSGTFVNRALTVDEDATICFLWNTCESCVVGTNDLTVDETLFTIAPSLVDNYTIINFNEELVGNKVIRVFNATGSLVNEIKVENGTSQQRINTENMTSGIYLVYVQAGNRIATKKIVKQ